MSQSLHVKNVSVKQRRANRLNAQRSTGPRTATGKYVVSLNALAHGIFCRDLVMPCEDRAEFETFAVQLLAELKPQGYVEMSVCEQYVEARWRIRRVRRAECEAHARFAAERRWAGEHAMRHTDAALRKLVPGLGDGASAVAQMLTSLTPPPAPDPAKVPISLTMADSCAHPDGGPYDRLNRLQQRLELSADRAMRQLHKLRAERRAHGDPQESPFVDAHDDTDDDDQDKVIANSAEPHGAVASATPPSDDISSVQNKPISEATAASPDDPDGCEQRSCNIEPVTLTIVPSVRGLGVRPERFGEAAPRERSGETPKPREGA